MTVGEVMRTGGNCPTVRESATLGDCHRAILEAPRRAGAACVVDASGKLAGIITHGDFFRLFTSREPIAEHPVSDVMTRSPKRIEQSARVSEALAIMQNFAIDELPVTDGSGVLTGLIDIQDLLARGFTVLENGA
jgi:arabinose-5-phosphate isomerase